MASRLPATRIRMPFAVRDQPFLMTRSEKGIRMAGSSGLRSPPVRDSAPSMSRNRGTTSTVRGCGGALQAGTGRLRDSHVTNKASDAAKVAPSATTRRMG